jgi:replicative DNA helicase
MTYIPKNEIAEGAVLGAALLNIDDCASVVENLVTEDFYTTRNQYVFNAIKEVFAEGKIPNLVTMNDYLAKKESDIGTYVLTELMESVPINKSVLDFIKIVRKVSYERKILYLSQELKEGIITLEEFTTQITELPPIEGRADDSTLEDLFFNTLKSSMSGVAHKTGFEKLDDYIGGLDYGETITVGGHTSQGKTMFGIQLAINLAEQGRKVLYCTSEMTPIETARRILSNQTHINIMDFRKGHLSEEEKEKIEQASAILGDTWDIIIKTVLYTSDIYKLNKKYNPDVIIVDHLQNMDRVGNYSDYQRVTYNMRDLQTLALSEKKPVVVLSQLKRKQEDGNFKAPRLSDLRDSGAIEEKSNIVLFVYWKKRLEDKVDARRGTEPPEEMSIIVSKNRDGVVGTVNLDFYPEYCLMMNRTKPTPVYRNRPTQMNLRKDIDG